MAMFADLEPRAPDAILGLMERFRADDRPDKVSLASGVYVDESGVTPVLDTVREAEARILASQTTKVYKPIGGDPAYNGPVRDLVFGADHPAVTGGRVETVHTPGGTGALRVAADLLASVEPRASVWLSTPTWPNHPQVFEAAGLPVRSYPYLGEDGELDIETMLGVLRSVPAGDVVVLHGCCHNPTGIDPTPEQWARIAEVVTGAGALPLLDFAYQGFADGLDEDAVGLRALLERETTMFVASSFSKNFALYDERVGALSIVGGDARETAALLSHAKGVIRANYSNPPAHGGEIVAAVLALSLIHI
jgi:aspartate/tyrosine/aromatic aminotransferase